MPHGGHSSSVKILTMASFQFSSKDCGYVLLLVSCDCLANGDERHCIGSRSPCPDGM